MAQISYIKYTDVKEARRYDAEYFKPEYLEIEKKIFKLSNKPIGKIISLLTDYHANGSYQTLNEHVKLLDKNDYALMVRTVDFETDNFETDSKYLSEGSYNFLEKTKMFGGEIVINKIGNAGRVYFLQNLGRPVSLGMNQFMIRVNENINNYYLYTYLISYYGRKLLERRITGAVPLSIDKQSVKNVIVPILPQSFQLQIEQIVKSAHQKQAESKRLYREAEKLLLSELGLLDYQVKHALSFFATKKEVERAHRYDSEYFQPKYAEIIKKIESYVGGWNLIKNAINFKDKNYAPKADQKYKYLALSNISSQGYIQDYQEEFGKDLPSRARRKININDLIISSIEGSLSSCALVEEEFDNSICSTGFFVLNSKKINSETLLVLFKSLVIQELLQRGSKGTILTAISKTELESIKIPLIKPAIQEQIAEKIQESRRLRKESKELLEEAKRKVEEEIEK